VHSCFSEEKYSVWKRLGSVGHPAQTHSRYRWGPSLLSRASMRPFKVPMRPTLSPKCSIWPANQDGNKVVVGLDLDAFHDHPNTSKTCCLSVGCVCRERESENSFGSSAPYSPLVELPDSLLREYLCNPHSGTGVYDISRRMRPDVDVEN
jgi:hypothetical protein